MSKKLFAVDLEIKTSPLFVAAASLILLGVKVGADDDLGKYSRLLIEAGYLHWLRDASTDEGVAKLMFEAKDAAERAEVEHNIEPDFESCVRVFATDLLNYYGGMFGIANGVQESQRKAEAVILKSVSMIRNLDHLREHIESVAKPEDLAKARNINDRIKSGELTTEQALREAGAPEEVIELMTAIERRVKGEPSEA